MVLNPEYISESPGMLVRNPDSQVPPNLHGQGLGICICTSSQGEPYAARLVFGNPAMRRDRRVLNKRMRDVHSRAIILVDLRKVGEEPGDSCGDP